MIIFTSFYFFFISFLFLFVLSPFNNIWVYIFTIILSRKIILDCIFLPVKINFGSQAKD